MAEPQEPRAPFVFHDGEPLIGEGPVLGTRRRRAVTLAVVILLLVGAVALLQVPRWLASRDLDPAVNARTGLADGRYVLEPEASMRDGDACWFRGPVQGRPDAGEVTVAGSGLRQCARVGDEVARVEVVVTDGTATIVRLRSY